MQYQAFDGQPEIEGTETLEDIFREIEINARSSGKTDLLLMLDRVPGQIIGHDPDGHPNSPGYGHLKLPHLN